MKFEIDYRPSEPNSINLARKHSWCVIRIYPENVEDVAKMEQIVMWHKNIERMISDETVEYIICLEEKKDK